MPLRILLDLQGAENNSRTRGIGRFSTSFARSVVRNAGDHQVFVLRNGLLADASRPVDASTPEVVASDRILRFETQGPVAQFDTSNDWRRVTGELLREYVVDLLDPDVVLATSIVEGAEDDTLSSIGRLQSDVLTVAVLHDLIPMTDPDRYLPSTEAREWYDQKVDFLRRADLLLAVSDFSARQAEELLGTAPGAIARMSSGVADDFGGRPSGARGDADLLRAANIFRPYLMHSGAFEPRKNFQGLVRAFASLDAGLRRAHQLVLVCGLDAAGRRELTSLAASLGLDDDELVLTGFVSDELLVALYSNCHLFVFPSFVEGFGLPALEAMTCGAATIGADSSSVAEVIGRPDALFDPASLPSMAALMTHALEDAAFHRSLKEHAVRQAARYSLDETARTAWRSIERLVAEHPRARPARDDAQKRQAFIEAVSEVSHDPLPDEDKLRALARHVVANETAVARMKATAAYGGALSWHVEGPFDSHYSLALVNRETARGLDDLGHHVTLRSCDGPGDFNPDPAWLACNPRLAILHSRSLASGRPGADVVSRNMFPPRVDSMHGRVNLLHLYAWEETGFPPDWIRAFDRRLQAASCISVHTAKILLDHGLRVPVTVSGCGVDHWERIAASRASALRARTFRFLHVSSCFPRKGVDALLDAYGKAFRDADDVSLVIKTFANPHNDVHAQLEARFRNDPAFPHVVIDENDATDEDLKALFEACDVLVAPSRAEGFGLPLAEAMLSGLPVVTTAWSGQTDFCTPDNAWLVDFEFTAAETHLALLDSVWAEPDRDSLADALLRARSSTPTTRREMARAGRRRLLEDFAWKDVCARLVGSARAGSRPRPEGAAPLIGWVTTWNTRCGIASYSSHLLRHFPPGSVAVLAPHERQETGKDLADCTRCWRLSKDDNDFAPLALRISSLALRTVVLQFNYGFYNFPQLAGFLDGLLDDGRAVVVVMHSTGDPGVEPAWNWSLSRIAGPLSRCHRVLVHSIGDLNRLKALGLAANVTWFPHGYAEAPPEPPGRPPGRDDGLPVLATFGYCLPHKGLLELVRAVGTLRDRGTPTRLLLLASEYPDPSSAETMASIQALIDELALRPLIEVHHEHLDDDESVRQLRRADLLVYAYQATAESASGAVRYGLAAERPVAVTPVPIFDELGDAVHRLPGSTPILLADGLLALLTELTVGSDTARHVREQARRWRLGHRFPALAARLHGLCLALAESTPAFACRFDGSSTRFRSDVGRLFGRRRVATGVAGRLLWGPRLAVPAGHYDIVVEGGTNPGSSITLSVTRDGGRTVLANRRVDRPGEGVLARMAVAVHPGCADLEIVVVVDAGTECHVDAIDVRARSVDEPGNIPEDLPRTSSRTPSDAYMHGN